MGTAWSNATDPRAGHDAVRERAGMFDISPLETVFLRGPDAAAVLDHPTTRDTARITPGQAAHLCVLTGRGTIADAWMIVRGSGDTMAPLGASAEGRDAELRFTGDLHDISVQGPKAPEILDAARGIEFAALAQFHHAPARLIDLRCRISRTGDSGGRGYEIFADRAHVAEIQGRLAAAGAMPCAFTALDKLRIEAALLSYGHDMTDEHTRWDVGLGVTVTRGRAARPVIRNVGLGIDRDDMAAGGETPALDGAAVGSVDSPCHAHRLGGSLALAHLRPDIADGTALRRAGDGIGTTARVIALPEQDPARAAPMPRERAPAQPARAGAARAP